MIYLFKAHDLRPKLKFDIELEQGKRVYCFLGENGAGKTQLLENMGRALMLSHKKFRTPWSGNVYQCLGEAVGFSQFLLSRDLSLNGSSMEFESCAKPADVDYTKSHHGSTFTVKTDFCCDLPLCFISAENRGYAKNISSNPELLANAQTQFLRAVRTSLTEMKCLEPNQANDKNIADWIATRTIMNPDTLSFDYKRVLEEVDLLFKILSPLMPRELPLCDSEGKLLVRYEPVKLYVANTEIDKLPTGVISLMRIMQEIISCYGAWNGVEGERPDDILQTEGIVFIDEIEAHMHPKWQAAIIPLLKKSFPKTTFYIATHSPAIIATTEQGEAYELKRDGEDVTAQALGNPRDWYLEDIFSVGFDVRLPQKQDGQETIEDRILDFSKLSQELMREEDTENKSKLKYKITEMYRELSEQFKTMPDEAKNDPRRDALEEIWEYAQ